MDSNTEPAGGLRSTAYELGKWLLFHAGDGTWERKRVISNEMTTLMGDEFEAVRSAGPARN